MKVSPLQWDSSFFGLRVAKAEISSNLDIEEIMNMHKYEYDLIYVFAQQTLTDETLQKFNGRLVDNKVILKKNVGDSESQLIISEYKEKEISKELYNLAIESGNHSRFKIDTRLPADSFERLYKTWINESVNGEFADKVYIYSHSNKIIGFVTVKIELEVGKIGLIAIDESYRGKGVGKQLIYKVESYLKEEDVKILTVATQKNNSAAMKFYQNIGFKEFESTLIYHFINDIKNTDS